MPMEFLHGRPLSPDELEMIRQRIEALDDIGAVDDEIRGIVKRNWPHLLAKLPPELPTGGADHCERKSVLEFSTWGEFCFHFCTRRSKGRAFQSSAESVQEFFGESEKANSRYSPAWRWVAWALV